MEHLVHLCFSSNCFRSIFQLGQIYKFRKSLIPRKKILIKIQSGYAHLYIMSFITTTFQEILLSGLRGVVLTRKTVVSFVLAKFQKGRNSEKKKLNQNFLWISYLYSMSFITTKFHEILLSSFRGVALTRKTGLTD